MAIITRRTTCKITRSKLRLLLAAIAFISLALTLPQLISVYREDDIHVVHRSSDRFVIPARSQLSLANASSTSSSFAQTLTRPIQPFTAQLTTTSQPEEGANRSTQYGMLPRIRAAFKGMVPEKVVIPDGRNIHFSVRTAATSYANRFPVVFLTWLQTTPPHNVSRFHDIIFKLTRDNDSMVSCIKYMSLLVLIHIHVYIYI